MCCLIIFLIPALGSGSTLRGTALAPCDSESIRDLARQEHRGAVLGSVSLERDCRARDASFIGRHVSPRSGLGDRTRARGVDSTG